MKRVAYICADPDVPVFGARRSSLQVQEMIRALQRHGAEVDLFAASLGGVAPAGFEQVAVHTLAPLPKAAAAERERAALAGNAELKWLLNDAGRFDAIYERQSLWSYAGMEAAAEARVPGVLEVNAALIEEQIEYRVLVDRASAEQVGHWTFNAASLVLAATRPLAWQVQQQYACDVVRIAPPGVNPERFAERANPFEPRRTGSFTIGFAGALGVRDGLPLLLEAFAVLRHSAPEARLLIVGDGPERDALSADITARGLQSAVRVTGAVPVEDIPELLGRMDAAVALSAEANPSSSLFSAHECMVAGVPLVVARGSAAEDLVEHNASALVCAADASVLASALQLVSADARLRARLGSAARTHVLRYHTWDTAATRVLALASVAAASAA